MKFCPVLFLKLLMLAILFGSVGVGYGTVPNTTQSCTAGQPVPLDACDSSPGCGVGTCQGTCEDATSGGTCVPLLSKQCLVNCPNATATLTWAENFLQNFLDPFYTIILVSTRLLGVFLVFWGLMRLRRAGAQNMMQRVSPIGTIFFFIVGAIFTSFMPEVLTFSTGFFGGVSYTVGSQTYSNANQELTYACTPQAAGGNGVPLADRQSCPVLGYLNRIESNEAGVNVDYASDPSATLMQVVYAILLVVGLISFLRGCLFLLKLGEGGSQENSAQKAVVHIVAGVIGMNAEVFEQLISGVMPSSSVFT